MIFPSQAAAGMAYSWHLSYKTSSTILKHKLASVSVAWECRFQGDLLGKASNRSIQEKTMSPAAPILSVPLHLHFCQAGHSPWGYLVLIRLIGNKLQLFSAAVNCITQLQWKHLWNKKFNKMKFNLCWIFYSHWLEHSVEMQSLRGAVEFILWKVIRSLQSRVSASTVASFIPDLPYKTVQSNWKAPRFMNYIDVYRIILLSFN